MRAQALKYLGYRGQPISDEISQMLDECITEVKEYAKFKAIYQTYEVAHLPLGIPVINVNLDYPALNQLLATCSQCIVIACTLGLPLEQRIRYYGKFDHTKMIVMDAIASAYVEECCDQFEANLALENRTFRFCPGYEQTPLSINRQLAKVLDIHKYLGIELTDGDLMIPQKSMIGIIGLGTTSYKKTCETCLMKEHCDFRRRGTRCYKID